MKQIESLSSGLFLCFFKLVCFSLTDKILKTNSEQVITFSFTDWTQMYL